MSSVATPEQSAFPYHAESRGRLQAPAGRVFAHLDDHTRLSAHMSRRSWRMGWGRMDLHLDERAGRAVGSRIRLEGRILGVWLALEEVVTEHAPPTRKYGSEFLAGSRTLASDTTILRSSRSGTARRHARSRRT
jgi:hypothetical protein